MVNTDPDLPSAMAGLTYKRYTVNFYENNHSVPMATSDFYDIYDPEHGGQPTPPKDLIQKILWSPQKDFAVLGRENWPPSKGPTYRKAVSLDTSSPWQTADFRLEDEPLVWMDRYHVAGNQHEHCRRAVAVFNGETGKMETVSAAASPIGYTLGPSTSRQMIIRKVLDECATDRDRATFVPECTALHFSFMLREIIPCPQ